MKSKYKRIAVLGTGLMGAPMARKFKQAGNEVAVFNRTVSKARLLEKEGIRVVDTPQEAIYLAEGVVTMLADGPSTEEVLLNPAARSALQDKAVLQMGTIGSSESRNLETAVLQAGGEYLEAPVLGSIAQIETGTLFVMAAGHNRVYSNWEEVLRVLGKVYYVGVVGQAASLKLAFNHLIAAHATAFALSLGIVRQAGVEVEQFMRILRESALYAPTFDKKLGRMLKDDFGSPNFPAKWMLKDIQLVLQEAVSLGLQSQGVEAVEGFYRTAVEFGWGELDYSTVYRSVDPSVVP